ncbi:unnamed protein product [Candidula unifasciata]|uniref:WD repeat-containing protein on Y chromosome n=1 Tax=Candidula unifasciata TaxID=100452 RepID=A0A8S3ZRB7_9EUPU|nr:unnamed protein product [Candidula unifasciata]
MGELLQLLRTFVHLVESDTNIELGEKSEFLRGTFSILELNENSKQQLDELKAKFLRIRKEMNGLDNAEFEQALMPMLAKGVSTNHIQTTFMKMDPCDEGQVTWNDFINFAIEEHSKRLQMRGTMDEMPFAPDVITIKHQHKDPITKITFMPTVDVNTKHIDWGIGKYLVLSREGMMSVWSSRMRNKGYANLTSRDRKDGSWYTDMVAMYHNNFISVATTARDISFYDYTQQGWTKKYWLRRLPHCVTCMSYWAGLEIEQVAVLLWGDTSGSVSILEFDLSQMSPMFGVRIREVCNELWYSDLVKGEYSFVTLRMYKGIHKNWIKEVKYIPQANSFVSCCMDDSTALYMSHVDTSKKAPTYFACYKGVLCFDYSHELNILVAAGIDCNIWMYNPYIPHKVVAVLEGHVRPVAHVKINEEDNYCISVDLSKTIIISNLSSQEVIMRIPGQTVRMGNSQINTVYLNSVRRMCLMGSYEMCMLIRQRVEGLNVEVRSHDHKLVGALYSTPLEQVVSVCRGSMVRVWDIITGTRVMQFGMAHCKKVQGRMIPIEIECIALTENKKRLFTAAEGTIKIWNFSVGVVLRVLDMSHCQKITSIVMAKSLIYVTGWNKYINVFSDFKGEEALKKSWQKRHNEDCLSLCILEPNLIASSSYDGSIVVWSRETTESYCLLSASFNHKPELNTAVRGGGNKKNIMSVVADLDQESDDEEEQGEDSFMTIGKHLRKEGGWYRLLRALKKRQIEREKRRAAAERKDFSAKYKKKKRRMNMQGLSLVYESAVECMVFLESRRPIDPQTATLVAGGAECWLRFWSLHPKGGLLGQFTSTRRKLENIRCMVTDKNNEYLITGDTMGLLRIWDIKEFCNGEKLSPEDREAREKRLKKDFVYIRSPFKPEEILDTMERLREKRISVPDASKPRKNLKSPRLLSSVKCHTTTIVSVELIEDRNLILTSSLDLTVRLWTKNCTYIGTFGETWKPLPKTVASVVEKKPRIPKDILRCGSARTLYTLHHGHCPHWKSACYMIRRHIYEHRKEKQLEESRGKVKAERQARGEQESEEEIVAGEKSYSKVLGKFYTPRKRYMGPISLDEQNLPALRIFRGRAAPYHSTPPKDIFPMIPVHTMTTFLDIDSRRQGPGKHRRVTKQMMHHFNAITGESVKSVSNVLSSASGSDSTETTGPLNSSFNMSFGEPTGPHRVQLMPSTVDLCVSESPAELLNVIYSRPLSICVPSRVQLMSSTIDLCVSVSPAATNLNVIYSRLCVCVPRLDKLRGGGILEAIKGIESTYNNRSRNRMTTIGEDNSRTLTSSLSSCTASEANSVETRSHLQSESMKCVADAQCQAFTRCRQSGGAPSENTSMFFDTKDVGTRGQMNRYPDTRSFKPLTGAAGLGGGSLSYNRVEDDDSDDDDCGPSAVGRKVVRQDEGKLQQLPNVQRPKCYSKQYGPRFSHLL